MWNLLKGEAVDNLSKSLESIAKSEQAKSNTFFNATLDQFAYSSDDYTRLKSFIVDWYASLKSLISTQAQSSDPFSLPDEHLNELFRSFGYPYPTELSVQSNDINTTKVNFFLDLVNLYKIKGTPKSIISSLQYYGLKDVDLYEFWLKMNTSGDPYFLGNWTAGTTTVKTPYDIGFSSMTDGDPHWLMTQSQVKALHASNKINLPSRSPYFAIRPKHEMGPVIAIVERILQDEYMSWVASSDKPQWLIDNQEAEITATGTTNSLLELYLSSLYIFNETYSAGIVPPYQWDGTSYNSIDFFCYDGTKTDYTEIIDDYNDVISRPTTRTEREDNIDVLNDLFYRNQSTNFLINRQTAGQKLELVNSDLKDLLDEIQITEEFAGELLQSLLQDLWTWTKNNVGLGYLNIVYLILGESAFVSQLGNVIDFFKPYRARLLTIELIEFNNPLTDSLLLFDDITSIDISETFIDWATCNSVPCCPSLDTTCGGPDTYYSRSTYDCDSYYDIGAACDGGIIYIDSTDSIFDIVICLPDSTAVIDNYYISDNYYQDSTAGGIITDSTSPCLTLLLGTSGGFSDFDNEGKFDCPSGADICQVYIGPPALPFLLEDGSIFLLENGSPLYIEDCFVPI